jgi:hypothetical protein
VAVGSEGTNRLDRKTRKALMCFFDGCSQFLVCQDCVGRDPRALDDRPTAYLFRNALYQLALRPINGHDFLHRFYDVSQRPQAGQPLAGDPIGDGVTPKSNAGGCEY